MEDNDEEQKPNYVYFIESHNINEEYNIFFSNGATDKQNPEFIYEKTSNEKTSNEKISNNYKNFYLSLVYRIKIININEKFEIKILLVEKRNSKIKYGQIINKDMLKGNQSNYFLYNLEFIGTEGDYYHRNTLFPKTLYNRNFQFHLYLESIENKFKDPEKQNLIEDLILSSQNILVGVDTQFNLMSFITVFVESYKTKYFLRQINMFKIKKIKGLGDDTKENINKAKDILNLLYDNPEEKLINLKPKRKAKYIGIIYNIIFYFNLYYQKEKINTMLDNDNINENLFKLISAEFKYELPLQNISKEVLDKLIKETKNFSEIVSILKCYRNSCNCGDLLCVISENIHFISEKYNNEEIEINKKGNRNAFFGPLEIGNKIRIKENDDLANIIVLIKAIISELNETKINFIYFSPLFFEKYIQDYKENEISKLLMIKNIYFIRKYQT
jgi:hypothetical protein